MNSTQKIAIGGVILAATLLFFVGYSKFQQAKSNAPDLAAATPPPGAVNVSAPSAGKIAKAAVDIPAGSLVTADMLKMDDYSGPSTVGFITDIDEQAAGFITRVAIPKDGQIRPDEDFIGHISKVGIAGALRPGTRALVLPLPGKPTLHDLVKIGNSVDVIAAFDGQESRTIVENVRVLAVDVFANDYPQVNAAMRGAYKAEPQGRRIAPGNTAPGASGSGAGAPPDSVPPEEQPTPAPENLPPLDPALTLEVTPQQAAAIQLALASQAPLDFLVRPALPGNRSGEITLVGDDGTLGAAAPLPNSVTKRQIAPYAEAIKNRDSGRGSTPDKSRGGAVSSGDTRTVSSSGSSGSRRSSSRNSQPLPDFPDITTTSAPSREVMPMPFTPSSSSSNSGGGGEFGSSGGGSSERLAPAAPSTYQIPIYSNGGVVRTETVPVPVR